MNMYRFYCNGKLHTTCHGNVVTENHISACADLGRKGLTPYIWHDPETGKDIDVYTDSFKLEKVFRDYTGNWVSRMITPENIGILSKSLQKELSAFDYDGEEWKVNKNFRKKV